MTWNDLKWNEMKSMKQMKQMKQMTWVKCMKWMTWIKAGMNMKMGMAMNMKSNEMTWNDMNWNEQNERTNKLNEPMNDIEWMNECMNAYITWHDMPWYEMTWNDLEWHDMKEGNHDLILLHSFWPDPFGHQFNSLQLKWLEVRLIYWLLDCLIDCLLDPLTWLIVWLIDW